jgi:BirA family biotin operon repressor/biotin-[acetyl-CoA-carboxylase] ligase
MNDLSADRIERELRRLGSRVGAPLSVVESTGSTNDDARMAASLGAPDGAAFFADTQHGGRGRGKHTWHSPPGENIYLSVVLRPSVDAGRISSATLAVGAGVAALLENRFGAVVQVGIKWPNDVLAAPKSPADGATPSPGPERLTRKVAGILVEAQLRGAGVASLVVGVGLNVRARTFPSEFAHRATSLALLGCDALDRSVLGAQLCDSIATSIARFEADGLKGFLPSLTRLDALRGAHVSVASIQGIAAGIDAGGALLVRQDTGSITRVTSGEVVVSDSRVPR